MTCSSGRLSVWVMRVLRDAEGPVRFSQLQAAVGGITQKVLTQTLRSLERDGLASRTIFPQVPPRVEYGLTELGREFVARIEPVVGWTRQNVRAFEAAQERFDAAASSA